VKCVGPWGRLAAPPVSPGFLAPAREPGKRLTCGFATPSRGVGTVLEWPRSGTAPTLKGATGPLETRRLSTGLVGALMEPPQKNSRSLVFNAMDWQGPAARRAGVVLLLLVCIGLGIAIAGIPSSAGNPRPISVVAQATVSSSSTTTAEAGGTTTSGPATTSAGPGTTFGRGVTTTTAGHRSTPTT